MTGLATTDGRGSGSDGSEMPWEQHRTELTAYCYRMLGSAADAEDAVQDTMVRAWKGFDRFEGRAALRSWLYRIATNVCLTMLEGRRRRARPMDFGPSSTADSALGPPLPESTWLQPVPDAMVLPAAADPADMAVSRESIRLAFVAALQHLPARQRAVLILREVLQWKAAEVAELLGTTVASVNSALQRARATLAANDFGDEAPVDEMDDAQRDLLARYAAAFERYDVGALVALLHEDAILSMPPFELWLRGPEQIGAWFRGTGCGCEGSKVVPLMANGLPAFGQYRPAAEGRPGWEPFAVQVLEISGGRITHYNAFLDSDVLFPMFGLARRLDEDGQPAGEW